MASKKYFLVMALIVFVQAVSFAQTSTTDWGWNWKDSSKIPVQRIPQYNEFLNNQYPYPAKPRDQWELGINLGHALIVGSVPVGTASSSGNFSRGAYNGGFVFGGSLRKSLGHVFSLRATVDYSSVHIPYYINPTAGVIKTTLDNNNTLAFSIDALASLNTSSYYRGNPKGNFYVLGGYSLVSSSVTKTFNGQNQNFPNISVNNAISGSVSGNKLTALYHALDAGVGYAFKVSDRVNIGIEEKALLPLPGLQSLQGVVAGNLNNWINYATARVNINLGDNTKRVQPLWWINPNNFVYSELNSPKHMKMPKVVLPDADGDGVTDQFDLEPNTPAGAPVDSHGRAKDTDGDGVPDYRDKEPLTPLNCFPVNNDGVGHCPEPACCKELRDKISNLTLAPAVSCSISNLPSIQFKNGAKLSKDAERLLAAAAVQLKANPTCKVKLIGYGASSKAAQQLSWERVSAIEKYLVEKQGIAENRFIFTYGQEGSANTVDLQGTTEDGPNTVPAPHPNLKGK
jgi:outer membrane protein OmpA-like peptidoglycan-associated protein